MSNLRPKNGRLSCCALISEARSLFTSAGALLVARAGDGRTDGACLSWRAPEDEAPAKRHAPEQIVAGGSSESL